MKVTYVYTGDYLIFTSKKKEEGEKKEEFFHPTLRNQSPPRDDHN